MVEASYKMMLEIDNEDGREQGITVAVDDEKHQCWSMVLTSVLEAEAEAAEAALFPWKRKRKRKRERKQFCKIPLEAEVL